jgi:hypothetical protein
MDSPKIIAKKKAYRDKLMKKLHPECDLFFYPEEDEGNANWMYTASLLASGDPDKIAEANRLLNTPTQMVFFDKDGKEIEFTEDGPDPEP